MDNWRPEGWYSMVESPYMHNGVQMAKENPGRALELELQHEAFRIGQEAGANAMLEALRRTGTPMGLPYTAYANERKGTLVFIPDDG